ncbi:olfactory receptor 6N1-like [Anomaloglossus baeobatrachus]|uniref:olfactory receptor 6N1-like n=1 Tax=Anomaloglossus baeobatrachus TaxID=238106 RepID=UPI003F50C491
MEERGFGEGTTESSSQLSYYSYIANGQLHMHMYTTPSVLQLTKCLMLKDLPVLILPTLSSNKVCFWGMTLDIGVDYGEPLFLKTKIQKGYTAKLSGFYAKDMTEYNVTVVKEFFLLGFQGGQCFRICLFCLLLVIYCGTICGNLLIIALVSTSKILHTPMYFFISQLSISDILLTTNIAPNMFHILLNDGAEISFVGCITQFCFFGAMEASECFLLTVMSYDRYVAICNPLRYTSIMTNDNCRKLAIVSWLLGFAVLLLDTVTISSLLFCASNIIDHFFCDILPLLEIACSGTFIVQIESLVLSIPAIFTPTTIIIYSYTNIVLAIIRIPSSLGRQKAFSTCSSHLTVVCIFYWSIFSVYVVPTKRRTLTISKVLSLLYIVFTPMINPIIYSFRNKDIKKSARDMINKYIS